MRKFEICLGRRPTEFDLCLGKRVTQCDLIVCNIPFQDGISADEAMILEDCLKNYVLLKFVAAQSGSELVSHIDEMIELVCERLASSVEIISSVDLSAMYEIGADSSELVIGAEDMQTLAVTSERAANILELSVPQIALQLSKPVDPTEMGIAAASGITAMIEQVSEYAAEQSEVALYLEEEKHQFEQAVSALEIGSEIGRLLQQVDAAVQAELVLDNYLADILLEKSFANAAFVLEIGSLLPDGGLMARKYETARDAMEVYTELALAVGKIVFPHKSVLEIDGVVDVRRARYRLLSDMDSHALSDYDDMTMTEVDFIFLD